MNNTLNYNPTSTRDCNLEQLQLPLNLGIMIDKNDALWTFLEIIREVNLGKYLKHHKGNQGYDSFMMFKVVLFAYMNQVYSLRDMEERCRTDIRFIYLSNEEKPSFMAFQRFIANTIKGSLSDVFAEINAVIAEKDNVNTRILYLDGTKIEANANKFTFVWKKTAEKTLKKELERAQDTVEQLVELSGVKYRWKSYTHEHLSDYINEIRAYCRNTNIEFVYGKGKRKTPVQRSYDELIKHRDKIKECQEKKDICGPDRNSYSKTDHDATMMHMKEDYYMHTGVFKAGYNVQVGVSDEYIRHILISPDRTDTKTLIPFINSYEERYKELMGILVADAGYGSFENYMYCREKDIGAYVKYNNYRIEKTAKFKKQIYRKENLLHEEDGRYYCPNGKEFKHISDSESKYGTYTATVEHWECESCEGCPFKTACTKAVENRAMTINRKLDELKKEAKENLDSEAGIQLRQQRSIQAEGTFGVIKEDWNYVRLHRRGLKNVENELYLVSIGFNLKKYHMKKLRKILS